MNALQEILSENNGSLSFSRIATAAIVLFVLGKNIYLTVHTGVSQPLDWTEITAMLGALGLKVAQKPFEPSPPPTTTTTTTTITPKP